MREYRDHYFPNTEPLAPNEMRIIALGTGRPYLRKDQVNTGWLVELGNGDKFLIDFGFGTQLSPVVRSCVPKVLAIVTAAFRPADLRSR